MFFDCMFPFFLAVFLLLWLLLFCARRLRFVDKLTHAVFALGLTTLRRAQMSAARNEKEATNSSA